MGGELMSQPDERDKLAADDLQDKVGTPRRL